jgi:hypothetical protein
MFLEKKECMQEVARKSLSFQGALIFNELSNELCIENFIIIFKNKL